MSPLVYTLTRLKSLLCTALQAIESDRVDCLETTLEKLRSGAVLLSAYRPNITLTLKFPYWPMG